MNITRYKWPVIIAAGLHGALFIPISTDCIRVPSGTDDKVALPPIPKVTEIDLPVPVEAETSAPSAGGGEPVTTLPEAPPPLDLKDPFEIPPVSRAAPEKSSLDLKNFDGSIGIEGGKGPGGFAEPSIFKVVSLDRVPRAMARPAPAYPAEMRRDGITGDVTIEFIVGTDGSVISAEAVRWSRREFVEPAETAVRKWRFEPGTVNGRKVRFRMAIPIEFYATN
jgi:TonB family protein